MRTIRRKNVSPTGPLAKERIRILEKAGDDQKYDDTDRKGGNDADRLQIAHGALRKHERNRERNQQQAPGQQKADQKHFVQFLHFSHFFLFLLFSLTLS